MTWLRNYSVIWWRNFVGEQSRRIGLNINTNRQNSWLIILVPDQFTTKQIFLFQINLKIIYLHLRIASQKGLVNLIILGHSPCERRTSDTEIRRRLEKARTAFLKLNKERTSSNFDIRLKVGFINICSVNVFMRNWEIDAKSKCSEWVWISKCGSTAMSLKYHELQNDQRRGSEKN